MSTVIAKFKGDCDGDPCWNFSKRRSKYPQTSGWQLYVCNSQAGGQLATNRMPKT